MAKIGHGMSQILEMAENKSFWIEDLQGNPVEIETDNIYQQMVLPPLTNAGHLISALKQEPATLLANIDNSLITHIETYETR
jgi:hypothetical protein